ncbi:hypothetical protein [Streptomyces sp. NPDC006132]|uniref:hypothetical protein n=1 Tax=Streptomyces sp. NPDC006132 TaxID=3156732 RepID=UPI0033C298B7
MTDTHRALPHLVRLLRIKHLTVLGFSLSQIADMRDGPDPAPDPRDLGALDAELADSVCLVDHSADNPRRRVRLSFLG